jgi:2-polyprenyl-3-methyl-5-hydroxy-6-metoxy-1,4-benzoquinol methylase
VTAISSAIPACPICSAPSALYGRKCGAFRQSNFDLHRCPKCSLAFVANPWTEFKSIYSQDYYAGKGADPLIDYLFELVQPDHTIRVAEWRGILRAVNHLHPVTKATRWLDYGCGNGGQVRYARDMTGCEAVGFEEGWIADQARKHGIPILTPPELEQSTGTFDIITLIEVIEHCTDPVAVFAEVRRLLKPGGLVFLTTGNAQPHREKLIEWSYFRPEIHVSLFEPETIEAALRNAGLEPFRPGWVPGWSDIVRFKVLKNLKIRANSFWHDWIPWTLLCRLIDTRLNLSSHPAARLRKAAE